MLRRMVYNMQKYHAKYHVYSNAGANVLAADSLGLFANLRLDVSGSHESRCGHAPYWVVCRCMQEANQAALL